MPTNKGFIKGNICRIYMKNFVTYDDFELFTNPQLNVIISPNGTGKSSILCGICIGLGGKPSLTGRGKSIVEYIKHGKSSAVIEIELFDTNESNCIIRREFNRENKTTWFLQNEQVREKKVSLKYCINSSSIRQCLENVTQPQIISTVSSFKIQVNNLCQFLPQDRVKEFSTLNKEQLLISTEKVITDTSLIEMHESLSGYSKTFFDFQKKIEEKKLQLQSEMKKNSQIEDQVRNIETKKQLEKAVKLCNTQINFCRREMVLKECNVLRASLKRVSEQCTALNSQCSPQLLKIEQLDKDITKLKSSLKTLKLNDFCDKLINLRREFNSKTEKITVAEYQYKMDVSSNERLKIKINDLAKQLELLMARIKEQQSIEEKDPSRKIEVVLKSITDMSSQIDEIRSEKSEIQGNLNVVLQRKTSSLQDLSRICDVRSRKMQILNATNRAAFNAATWLESNKDLFKGVVHGPMFLQTDLADQSAAKYLENAVRRADLLAFVCENKFDVPLLLKNVKSRGWRINVVHSNPVNCSNYKSFHSIHKIKSLGFKAHLSDAVRAPPAIFSFLCRNYNINNIPYGDSVDYDNVPTSFGKLYIGNKCFAPKRSVYDNERTVAIYDIAQPFLLKISSEPQKEKDFQTVVAECDQKIGQLNSSLQDLKNKERSMEMRLEALRQELQQKKQNQIRRRQLEESAIDTRNKIEDHKRNICDLDAANKVKKDKIKNVLGEIEKISFDVMSLTKKMATVSFARRRTCVEITRIDWRKQKLNEMYSKALAEINAKREEKKRLENRIEELDKDVEASTSNMLSNLGLKPGGTITKELKLKILQQMELDSSSEISEILVSNLHEKVCHLENRLATISTVDTGIVDEYNNRLELIKEIQQEVTNIEVQLNNGRLSVEDLRRSWLPKIGNLTRRINDFFSGFMSRLNCAGEVVLDRGKDEMDFANYGLVIKAKFRDGEKLMNFTEYQQSGGERSVITALYLMALQSLTPVPFRCVDEINQGMDRHNERNVFMMLVENTMKENASQYFLITPKLLPNLPYNNCVTFHTILNSPYVKSSCTLSYENIVKSYRRKKKVTKRESGAE